MAVECSKYKSFTKDDFLQSYNCGGNFRFLKIRSANDKGRHDNKRRLLKDALKYPYIQPNSDYNLKWFVFDIDRDFDTNDIFDNNLPMPNFILFNLENGHAQVWYRLKDSIWIQDKFKNKVYKYSKIVYEAMRDVLKADRHFNRALCKNPFFYADDDKAKKWSRVDFCSYEYTLLELRNHLDISILNAEQKKNKTSIDIEDDVSFFGAEQGNRNSSLFDFCRFAIYKHFSTTNCSEPELLEWSKEFITAQNENNVPPLKNKECEDMAKSISSWTYNNIQPCKKSKYDDSARERSLEKRRKKRLNKISKVKKFLKHNPHASNREIAQKMNFSLGCVNSYMKEIKEQQRLLENAKKNKEMKKANFSKSRFFMPDSNGLSEQFVNQFVCRIDNADKAIDNSGGKNGKRTKKGVVLYGFSGS